MYSPPDRTPGLGSFVPKSGHKVVFLGKAHYSHSASLQPGVKVAAGKFYAGGNPVMEHSGVLSRRSRKKYSLWLHATETEDNRRPDEPLGSCADLPKNLTHLPKNMGQAH